MDLPDLEAPDGYRQLAQALTRNGEQQLAIDTPSSLDLRQLTTRELRAEGDRLRVELDQAPQDRARELERAGRRRADADRVLAEVTRQADQQRQATGILRQLRRGDQATAIRVPPELERTRVSFDRQIARAWWLRQGLPEKLDDPAVVDAIVRIALPASRSRGQSSGSVAGTGPRADRSSATPRQR
jgi:hypothetical protein